MMRIELQSPLVIQHGMRDVRKLVIAVGDIVVQVGTYHIRLLDSQIIVESSSEVALCIQLVGDVPVLRAGGKTHRQQQQQRSRSLGCSPFAAGTD